jgi:ankyrin repeat protein
MAEAEVEDVPLNVVLRHAVDNADLMAIKEAHGKGQNLSVVIDDSGNTPLTYAINLGIDNIVDFLLEVLGPTLGQDEVRSLFFPLLMIQ